MTIIIPVRNPNEVIASLAARDKLTVELSSVLWLKYNLLAESRSRLLPRVFIEYPNWMSIWREELLRIKKVLSVDLHSPDADEVEDFLSPDLYRERHNSDPVEVFDQPWLARVYGTLSAAARGQPIDIQLMDDAFLAFRSSEKTFRVALDEFRARWPMSGPMFRMI